MKAWWAAFLIVAGGLNVADGIATWLLDVHRPFLVSFLIGCGYGAAGQVTASRYVEWKRRDDGGGGEQ